MLYHPTPAEISAVIEDAQRRTPSLASRLERAAGLLAVDALYRVLGAWRCESQSDRKQSYAVDFEGCGCVDYLGARATVHGAAYCKHKLALLAYREIMVRQIRRRMLGRTDQRHARTAAQRSLNAGLLIYDEGAGGPSLCYWANSRHRVPTSLCSVKPTLRGLAPATEMDLFAFASWLGQAGDVVQMPTEDFGWAPIADVEAYLDAMRNPEPVLA